MTAAHTTTSRPPRVPPLPVIGRVLAWRRWWRRALSRSEWGSRLLRLPAGEPSSAPGLILVQIDGLARTEFERAIARGRMPFVKKLLSRERYALHTFYSGVPATTPAVQAELFYGVRCAVPAFSYRNAELGRTVRMVEPEAAAHIEAHLRGQHSALLSEGSACTNIYSGGAAEPRFCAAAAGLGTMFGNASIWGVLLFLLINFWSILRAIARTVAELVVAVSDAIRGAIRGFDFWRELSFIPSRVGVGVLLRELATIAAEMDAARGVSVIQLNYLGYDEHAHRRGPDSKFAHFTLRGIDGCLARIWHAAHHSPRRMYALWIYSDHGQEKVIPYEKLKGQTIQAAVAQLMGQTPHDGSSVRPRNPRVVRADRVSYMRRPRAAQQQAAQESSEVDPEVVAIGPLGHVYFRTPCEPAFLRWFAQALVEQAGVPLALVRDGEDAIAWTPRGRFELPREAAEVLGPDHPLGAVAAADLVVLLRHPDAGQVVFCGWSYAQQAVSFVPENGAHAAVGPHETRAFTLLPCDAPWRATAAGAMRPSDLREAALRFLDRADEVTSQQGTPVVMSGEGTRVAPAAPRLRIATYNVHSCTGLDERISPERIARVLAQCDADVIALQEIDVRRARSRHVDQAARIAELLMMEATFFPTLARESEQYGDAVLSRYPLRLVRAAGLPTVAGRALEPRGALWVELDVAGQRLQLLNTHLGLTAAEQALQVEALLGPDWLAHPDCGDPVVVCGDFNFTPRSRGYRRMMSRLRDTQQMLDGHRPRGTWLSLWPWYRIDHVFVGPGLEVASVHTAGGQLAQVASDHLPLVVDLRFSVSAPSSAHHSLAGVAPSDSQVRPAQV